jgi:hypothetical protein
MLRRRAFWLCVGFVSICTLGAIVYAPQEARSQPPEASTSIVPQFVAEAVRFTCINQTGNDNYGSDEVYAVFSDLNPTLLDHVTKTFGDVDRGETNDFGSQDRCIAPRPSCNQGVSGFLRFKVSFWEEDWCSEYFGCWKNGDAAGSHQTLERGKTTWDDLIGRAEFVRSREQLLAELPRVGNVVERQLTLGGPCGPSMDTCGGEDVGPEYTLTFQIRRLPDVEGPIVVTPPR